MFGDYSDLLIVTASEALLKGTLEIMRLCQVVIGAMEKM